MKATKTKTLTLRLSAPLASQFDRVCKEEGYGKNSLLVGLIQKFLIQRQIQTIKPTSTVSNLKNYFGMFSIGGDALKETKEFGL